MKKFLKATARAALPLLLLTVALAVPKSADAAWIYVDESNVSTPLLVSYYVPGGGGGGGPGGMQLLTLDVTSAMGGIVGIQNDSVVPFDSLNPSAVAVPELVTLVNGDPITIITNVDWFEVSGIVGAGIIIYLMSFGVAVIYKQVATA